MTDIDRTGLSPGYWRRKSLDDMNRAEWEALCDGCGRCCLLKLEDEDTEEVMYTSVHCRLYDPDTCRCGNYAHRKRLVPGCVQLTPDTIEASAPWMPESCAYRRLFEGRELPEWHPLVTGDPESPRKSGAAMTTGLTPEWEVDDDDLEDFVVKGVL
ncbi:YcgN family cysteine cluster protein [Rhodovulum sp. DZ06]|uniref:YcgN family cysteine cluster protein n=1 Tax=Rhodovulum sp. DZ06 TaxID=3425126 RepID=UPI003D324BDD